MYEIVFYAKENGEEPAKEFVFSLDARMKAKTPREEMALMKKYRADYERRSRS